MILIEIFKLGCNVRAQITENNIITNYFEDRKNIEMLFNPQSNKINVNMRGSKTVISENINDENGVFFMEGIAIKNITEFLDNLTILMAC